MGLRTMTIRLSPTMRYATMTKRNYHDAVLAMSLDEMKDYYRRHFPLLLGQYLESIGRGLQDGTYELEISAF